MAVLDFQLLNHRVQVDFAAPEVGNALRYLALTAIQDMPATIMRHYAVAARPDGFQVLLDDAALGSGLDAEGVMRAIYASVYDSLFAAFHSHLRVHAGCATMGGRRVLFVGRKHAGKTTLMLRLLRDGHAVQGDETVLVGNDGNAVPLPRRFHVRAGSFAFLPDMAAARAAAPRLAGEDGAVIHALAPDELGYSWSITSGPVDALVFLRPHHGGDASLRPLAAGPAARRLARQTTLPDVAPDCVERLYHLLHCSKQYLLYNGDPEQTVALLRDAFRD